MAINDKIGDKSDENIENMIIEYLCQHGISKSKEIAEYIGLKISRTKDYLGKLQKENKIIAHGENKNRTYELK